MNCKRRVAAISTAKRVSHELNLSDGFRIPRNNIGKKSLHNWTIHD